MADAKEQITEIAQDLLKLEVNTLLSASIGQKMPPPYITLRDIARDYNEELQSGLYMDIENADNVAQGEKGELYTAIFDNLKEKAKEKKDELAANDPKLMIYWRIIDASGKISSILTNMDKRELFTSDELVKIRKIWELGTDVVVMQTVVQLDGDVIARIHPSYAGKEYQILHNLHQVGVSTSVNFWQELVNILQDFFQSLAKTFFPT